MFCINCGKQISDDLKFCIHCGARIAEEENPRVSCTGCGRALEEGELFCIQCGTPRGAARQPMPSGKPPRTAGYSASRGPLVLALVPILLTVVGIVIQWRLHTEPWFVYSCDDVFFRVMALGGLVVPLLCLIACMNRKYRKGMCWIVLVITILELLPQLAIFGLVLTEEEIHRSIPYMVFALFRNASAILALVAGIRNSE